MRRTRKPDILPRRPQRSRNDSTPSARNQEDAVRTVVLELWRASAPRWPRSDELVARTLRRFPHLTDGQRDQIISIFHGMLVHARKLEFALDRMNLPPDLARHRQTLAFTAYRLLMHWCRPAEVADELPGHAWFEAADLVADIAAEPAPARRLALDRGLPDFLAERLQVVYGDRAESIAGALGERAPQTLRVNTLKTTREALLARLAEEASPAQPTAHALTGLTFIRRVNAFKLPSFAEGLFELQDESSQLAAEIVAPPPGGLVIDFCAGAGGKTLALGALMRNKGRLIALDTQARKLSELRKRAARAGLSNLQALPLPATGFPPEIEALRGKAARVLVDVPCSGSGALRRNPEARWRLTPEDLVRLPQLQQEIARRAMDLVAPGGRLIYATCSILPEENEEVVAALLQPPPAAPAVEGMGEINSTTEPGAAAAASAPATWQPVLIKEILGKARAAAVCDAAGRHLQLLPAAGGPDGFFAAVLRKKA